ncbi:MAG TPA: hypothetical protein VFF30_01715 [Nitrososphaerales archaeon]|nr:hypothetical protein [Nitrososphaerales archaeon]
MREVKVERKDVENVVLSVRKAISCKSGYGGDAVALSIFEDCQRSESGPMIKPIAKMEKWNLYKAPSIDALIRVMFRASSFVFDPADLAHGVGPSVSIRGKVKAALTWFNKKKSRPCVLTVDNC